MQLYFVRHGESEANLLAEFSNRGLKHGLTEKGRQQALAFARTLDGVPITRIFSSPLLRALQTTEILAQERNLPYDVTDALREYDCGILEGRSDPESHAAYGQLTESWFRDREWDERIEGGESFYDIRQRFVPFIEALVQSYGASQERFLLVGHGGTYRCMLPLILTNIDFDFALAHGLDHTETILVETTPIGLVCQTWGRHIPGSGA